MDTIDRLCDACGVAHNLAAHDGRLLCARCVDTLRGLAVGLFDIDTLARTYGLSTRQVDTLRQAAATLSVTFGI